MIYGNIKHTNKIMRHTDLNKTCPKNTYSLLSINWLLDNIVKFQMLSFINAYSVYNQIRMYPQDEEIKTFMIDTGTYYYKVMPFGLKNVGATY